ncbi:MAG TPA: hypothetical protein VJB05_00275 [archaeon]|nr:hypothetical protein [archaeon]
MADQDISEIIYTMMSLLFLLLGIVLLVAILMSTINPAEQIAFANVEKLRAGMNQVCLNGVGGQELGMKFELPQNTPILSSIQTSIPRWIIKTNGDPNYVLYYEAFPVGDATGWEVYQDMQNRLIAQVNTAGMNSEDVGKYVTDQVIPAWNTRVVANVAVDMKSKSLEGIIINNIIIGETRSDYYLGEQTPGKPSVDVGPDYNQNFGLYGEWKDKDEFGIPLSGANKYEFKTYLSMSSFEKGAIKYEPCGVNTLCMKTRTGVYRFPLAQCEDIKYIEMKYDARNRKVIYGAAGIVLVVVVGGACILSTAGICAVPIAAGTGAVDAGALAGAGASIAQVGPGMYVASSAVTGTTANTFIATVGTVGGTATAFSTATSMGTAASGITLGSILSGAWSIAKGGASLLWKAAGFIPGLKTILSLGTATTGGVAGYKITEFIAGAFLSYKVQDFNMESPCNIKEMKIKMVDCQDLDCERFTSYPMYEYGTDGKLKELTKRHYTCVEKIGTDIDTSGESRDATFTPDDKCLQIVVNEKADGFCWTPDPYRDSWLSDTQLMARVAGFLPINQNTAYIDGSAPSTILKYYSLGDLETWKDYFERKFSWGWPG